jgi:two-component system phosphate regulon response regulator OmpR
MRRLRQKVEVDPNKPVHLQTVRGVGYRLVPTGPGTTTGG